ncbi:universal stress protein [Saccharopolyspora rosea]|uniref:Universal stress protein n=1 Tax=Saccharopolyspora rosea TaxID=524884 RepID=A0ABW3FZN3_9PSEU|nr:universal stress protein [Saccharopolyspora rosea]
MADTRPIVVGVHGSERSAAALRWAAREAEARQVGLRVVMAWQSRAGLAGPGPFVTHAPQSPRFVRLTHRMRLVRMVRECVGEASSVDISVELVEGKPVDVLVQESAGAHMLVLGRPASRRGIRGLLGSTVSACVDRAHCPVVVAPDAAEGEVDGREAVEPAEPMCAAQGACAE